MLLPLQVPVVRLRSGFQLALLTNLCLAAALHGGDQPPNIILFVADDQGWNGTSVQLDPSEPGSKSDFYQTPNLETLAAQGMRFSRAYSAAPLCQPTRVSIQTGMSPAQLQYTDNFEANRLTGPRFRGNYNGFPLTPPIPVDLSPDQLTIADWLDQNRPEYRSAHIGKWHINNSPERMGYDVGQDTFGVGQDVDPWAVFSLTDMAVNFMQQSVQSSSPFFVQLSHRAVHTPIRAREETIEMFDELPRGNLHKSAQFAAMTYELDTSLGLLLDAVRDMGIEDNTYIIYVSDNGSFRAHSRTDPLGGGKNFLQEGGIRVPLVVAGPGIEPGSASSVPVITTDLLSTISDLAGIDAAVPQHVEGTSFAPVLENGGELPAGMENLVRDFGPRGELFFHSPNNFATSANFRIPPMSAVVLDNWKLIKLWGENGEPDGVYLTDLDGNFIEPQTLSPSSSLNRAHQFPEIAADLDAALMRWLDGIDASLPYDVKENVELHWDADRPGVTPEGWRSAVDVDYKLREIWSFDSGAGEPDRVATQPFQPGLPRHAFSFDGSDRLTRKYFHVSDMIDRRNTPRSGTPDLDRSATFEFWVRLDSLRGEQVLFESGGVNQGLSLTLGDGDGDGVHDEVRFRAIGDDGQHLTTTATLNEFSNPTRDFVHLVAVLNDADDDRFAEIFVNGASMARTAGVAGPEGSIRWDGYNEAGLGGSGGSQLGASSGAGDRPFFLGGLRGDLASMRFFNHAISAAGVQEHYNSALDPVGLGVDRLDGAATVPSARPNDVSEGALESDSMIFVIQERSDVLNEPLRLDVAIASLENDTLEAGTQFTSYLLHFDPVGDPESLRTALAEISFASPILGVLTEPGSLVTSDALLGTIGRYDAEARLEPGIASPGPDAYSASFLLTAVGDAIGQLRVLTGAALAVEGDYNGDLRVDQSDLDLVLLNWGGDGSVAPAGWTTNLPQGIIGQEQLDGILLKWGNGPLRATAVPEPSGIALAGWMLVACLAYAFGRSRDRARFLRGQPGQHVATRRIGKPTCRTQAI